MGLQRVGPNWVTKLNLSHRYFIPFLFHIISAGIFSVHLYAFLSLNSLNSPVYVCVFVCSLSRVFMSDSLCTHELWNRKAHLSIGFSRQEYWSGLPCPPPGDLPDLGSQPASDLAGGFFTTEPPEKLSAILRDGHYSSHFKESKKGFMTSLNLHSA